MGNPIVKFTNQYNCTIAGEPEPTSSEDYYNRALKHYEIAGKNDATVDDCEFAALNEAIRLDPNNVKALKARGFSYELRKQYDLALADYDKAIQIEPKDSLSLYRRSLIYLRNRIA